MYMEPSGMGFTYYDSKLVRNLPHLALDHPHRNTSLKLVLKLRMSAEDFGKDWMGDSSEIAEKLQELMTKTKSQTLIDVSELNWIQIRHVHVF